MPTVKEIVPFSLRDAPSLIERVLPVQRLSIDVYKERMAGPAAILSKIGSYWKGRKPLVLNRACILGALLPATEDPKADLEIFELLLSMDDESLRKRLQLPELADLPKTGYREIASSGKRAEEIWDSVHSHIWERVNKHLGTCASNYPTLIEQLGLMRFGHRPRVADTFAGSGQIPFEAARLGCEVIASDLNPVACMLTWGAFNLVGASPKTQEIIEKNQRKLIESVRKKIDDLGFETDGRGWRGKAYLYCVEVVCPSTGWLVPVLPSRVISKSRSAYAKLIPVKEEKRYVIEVVSGSSETEMKAAEKGTYIKGNLVHKVDGIEHTNSISSIRGDYFEINGGIRVNKCKLRMWEISDIAPDNSDIYKERLYAIQWMRDDKSARPETEFRTVSDADLVREAAVHSYVRNHLADWQRAGLIPDMRIESGDKTDEPIRTRGWTHWHHLFNPRQLLSHALVSQSKSAFETLGFANALNWNSKMSRWEPSRTGEVKDTFYNQSINPLFTYAARGFLYQANMLTPIDKYLPIGNPKFQLLCADASSIEHEADIFITDPPYGDAVKYEEILEFFIAWIRKNPPSEFSNWVWDSRRTLAVKGEGHDFKLSMVSAYKRMAECMPYNGLQIVMFTHQSGSIWADMANIVWASGLRVTAAWYVVTETDSALREGQYVKGTILLVLRKRLQEQDAARDELAYELAEEVKNQVDLLTGLNRDIKELYHDENLFEDADLQMAGYAAALRVLTRYSTIDGVSMPQEAMRPRVKGQTTMVDELIAFAVNIANEYLVPEGVDRAVWEKSSGIERFYLKMLDMESKGIHVLSNYQNFAKAFKVQDYGAVMDEVKANHANLKSAAQLGARGMTTSEEFGPTVLRSVLYAVHLLHENKVKPEDVMHQLRDLVPDYFRERDRLTALADYVSKKTAKARPDESSNAMVLRDLVRRERV